MGLLDWLLLGSAIQLDRSARELERTLRRERKLRRREEKYSRSPIDVTVNIELSKSPSPPDPPRKDTTHPDRSDIRRRKRNEKEKERLEKARRLWTEKQKSLYKSPIVEVLDSPHQASPQPYFKDWICPFCGSANTGKICDGCGRTYSSIWH